MDKKLKKALEDVYRVPEPVRKKDFLKKYRRRELGRWDFLLTQAGYIRWWVWAASILLFGGVLWLASGQDSETVWVAAALTPFLALLIVVENGKSRFYGMEELELSCRIPLRAVVLARMIVLGLFHLLLLGVLIPVMAAWGAVGLFQAGLYLLTPYLLTAAIGLEISRRVRGNEGLLACATVAGLVCALEEITKFSRPELYQAEAIPLWSVALILAVAASALEFCKMMKETEELQWS